MLATQHRQECTLKQSQRAPGTDITETNNRKQYHTRQRLALPTLLFVTMHFGLVNSYPSIFNVEFFLKLIAHSVVPVDFSSLRESVWTRMTQSGRAKHKRLVYTETWLNRFNKHPELTIVTIFLRTVLPTLGSQRNGLSKLCQAPPGKPVLSEEQRGCLAGCQYDDSEPLPLNKWHNTLILQTLLAQILSFIITNVSFFVT